MTATHATRAENLKPSAARCATVRALNEALLHLVPDETPEQRIERATENLMTSIEQRHYSSHRAGQCIEECLDFICTDYTELRRLG